MKTHERWLWFSVTGAALALGVYWRFQGFAAWPLAEDEYFIARSVEYMLASGLPEFPCGGFYVRGILYQALVAPILAIGASPEAALRMVAIASNLAMFPAAALLARSAGGVRFACAVLICLALSAWEIEMARFGRMYAPFQAIFMWYVWHAYKLVETGDVHRWNWLFGLTVVGTLFWEGAVVLALCNFIPVFLAPNKTVRRHFFVAVSLLVAVVVYLTIEFRYIGSSPYLIDTGQIAQPSANSIIAWPHHLLTSPMFVAILALAATALGYVLYRSSKRTNAGVLEILSLAAIAISILASQILLALFIFVFGILLNWIRPRFAFGAEHRLTVVVLTFAIGVMTVLAVYGGAGSTLTSSLKTLAAFPDLVDMVVYPWLDNLPLFSLWLVLSAAAVFLLVLTRPSTETISIRLVFLILMGSLFVISAVPTLYKETRYSFFLYPLIIIVGGFLMHAASKNMGELRGVWKLRTIPIVLMVVFLASADFDYRHLASIDSYQANFRIDYPDHKTRHYYTRTDFRSAAQYVNANADMADTIVVASEVFSHYTTRADYMYMRRIDPRARGQICPNGALERWSGLPLLGSIDELTAQVYRSGANEAWILVDQHLLADAQWQDFTTSTDGIAQVFLSDDGRTSVYKFDSSSTEPTQD